MKKNNSNHKKKLSVDKIKACVQALGIRPAAKALKIPNSTVFGIVHDKKVPRGPSSTSALSQSDLVALKMAAAKLGGPNWTRAICILGSNFVRTMDHRRNDATFSSSKPVGTIPRSPKCLVHQR